MTEDDQLDWMFNTIDNMCWANEWSTIDSILRNTDISDTPLVLLIGLLTITKCVKDNLCYRDEFFKNVKCKCTTKQLKNNLLVGLE